MRFTLLENWGLIQASFSFILHIMPFFGFGGEIITINFILSSAFKSTSQSALQNMSQTCSRKTHTHIKVSVNEPLHPQSHVWHTHTHTSKCQWMSRYTPRVTYDTHTHTHTSKCQWMSRYTLRVTYDTHTHTHIKVSVNEPLHSQSHVWHTHTHTHQSVSEWAVTPPESRMTHTHTHTDTIQTHRCLSASYMINKHQNITQL